MKDFLQDLGDDHLVEISLQVISQLEKTAEHRPVLWLLAKSRKRAAEAMALLAEADVTKTIQLLQLQREIGIYKDLISDCEELLSLGREADREIDDRDREDIIDTLDPEEARQAGLQQTPEDT